MSGGLAALGKSRMMWQLASLLRFDSRMSSIRPRFAMPPSANAVGLKCGRGWAAGAPGSHGVGGAIPQMVRILIVAMVAGAFPAGTVAESAGGLALIQEGQFDEALAFYESSLEGSPDDVRALNMVGSILCMKNDPESSLPYFRRALEHSPDFTAARKNLAMAEFELGSYEAAEENLKRLLGDPVDRNLAILFLGMIASETGRHERAVGLLEDAGELVESQPRALVAYARSLKHVERVDQAKSVLAAARARDDLTGRDLVDAAQVAASLGQFDEALADLERAELADTTISGLGVRKVEVLVDAGRSEEALALAQGLAEAASSGPLLSRLAELSESGGDLDGAILALRKRIQLEPESADGYIALSEFCVNYRNPELALEILDLGLERIPKSYRLLVQKGITLGQGQRYDQARKAFEEAIERAPDHSVALTALAVTLILSEDIPEALAKLEGGVERFPNDFYMHYIYGFALDRSQADDPDQDKRAKAEEHLRRSIELNERFPAAYYRLGKLLAESDLPDAITSLEAAVRLDPELTAAKYQLGQLYVDSGRNDDGVRLLQEVGEAKQKELEEEQMPQFRTFKTPPSL